MDFKDGALGLAIAIMTIFVVISGIGAFYSSPEYNDFCPNVYHLNTQTECVNAGGDWKVYDGVKPTRVVDGVEVTFESGNCINAPACSEEYNSAREVYSRTIFIITLILGLVFVSFGMYFFKIKAIGSGILGGGVITLFYSGMSYWSQGEDWVRFLISLVGLGFLIFLAFWFRKADHV